MKILAMDSTAAAACAAVTEDEKTLSDFTCNAGKTHSQVLLPMALAAMNAAGVTVDEIGLFAVTVGPGSFTGVRIGVSTVKGLAFGRNVPCVGVSALEALAERLVPHEGILCPVMDARRGEVYNALFRVQDGALVRLCPDRALPLAELRAELERDYAGEPVCLVGDGVDVAKAALSGLSLAPLPPDFASADAAAVARCAYRAYRAGNTTTDAMLAPVYLRLPQAERERLAAQKP